MVSLGNEEQAVVEGLTACLAIAVRRSDRYSRSDLNQTKIQKFVYLGAKEFDLDVTYSWYLAGSYAAGAADGLNAIDTAFDSLPQPPSPEVAEADLREDASREEPRDSDVLPDVDDTRLELDIEQDFVPSITDESVPDNRSASEPSDEDPWVDDAAASIIPDEFDIPVSDVVRFYERLLRQYPLHPTDRFLQQFYEYHAPDEYAAIYEHCLRLRTVLSDIEDDIESVIDGRTKDIDLSRHRNHFGRELSEFHMELFAIESIRETADAVVESTEPIEEALIKLAALPVEDITEAHLEAVQSLQSYFYYTVWKYPALKISVDTAAGPDEAEIRREHREEYQLFEERVTSKRKEILEELERAGLRPAAADYSDGNADNTETIGRTLSLYQDRSE